MQAKNKLKIISSEDYQISLGNSIREKPILNIDFKLDFCDLFFRINYVRGISQVLLFESMYIYMHVCKNDLQFVDKSKN